MSGEVTSGNDRADTVTRQEADNMETQETTTYPLETQEQKQGPSTEGEREMPCPVCGHPMPDLKGGKDSICPVCGFKDSCCY
jgi:hypothetical protein